jgi:hypothetical protein
MRIPNLETIKRIHNECRGTKRDGHRAVAAWMHSVHEKDVTDLQRQVAKGLTFAVMCEPTHEMLRNCAVRMDYAIQYGARPAAPWKTRTGELIPLHKMSDAHLQNALAMLERRCADLRAELAQRAIRRDTRRDADGKAAAAWEAMADWDPRDDFSPGVW